MQVFLAPTVLRCFVSPIYARSVRGLVAAVPRKKAGSSAPLVVDFASLQVFKAQHGKLLVPIHYSLSPDTPGAGMHASRLGRHVDYLRTIEKSQPHRISPQDRALLNQMGFVWDAPKERFQLIVEGIVTYHKLNGNYVIPQEFVVPDKDPQWSERLWGLKLGQIYQTFRHTVKLPLWQVQSLKEKGIPLDLQDDVVMAERILAALEAYKVNMKVEPGKRFSVHAKFEIPYGDSGWDASLWGMRLGYAVLDVRYGHFHPGYRAKYHSLGLRIDKERRIYPHARILAALQAYKLHTNVKEGELFTVPAKFTIPDGDAGWDPALWGMKLGSAVSDIRNKNYHAEYHERFRAVGLSFGKAKNSADRVFAALEGYKRNMDIEPGQQFTVPRTFTVPHDDARWDSSLWGMPLGVVVRDIRHKNNYPDHHEGFRRVGLQLDKTRAGARGGSQGSSVGDRSPGGEEQECNKSGDTGSEGRVGDSDSSEEVRVVDSDFAYAQGGVGGDDGAVGRAGKLATERAKRAVAERSTQESAPVRIRGKVEKQKVTEKAAEEVEVAVVDTVANVRRKAARAKVTAEVNAKGSSVVNQEPDAL